MIRADIPESINTLIMPFDNWRYKTIKEAVYILNCEEYNPTLYYNGNYGGDLIFNQFLEANKLNMEWQNECIAYLYREDE